METPTVCEGCQVEFKSKNAVFKHLRETQGACLSTEDYQHFVQCLEQTQREKCLVLYGYRIHGGGGQEQEKESMPPLPAVQSGEDAVRILMETLGVPAVKYNRSFGHQSRASEIVRQDEGTAAVTEVLSINLPPILVSTEEWMDKVNAALPPTIRVFGRLPAPIKRFNAEVFVSHRRCEYVLPVDMLYLPGDDNDDHHTNISGGDDTAEQNGALHHFFQKFISFGDGETSDRPSMESIMYLFRLKKIMQSLQTLIIQLDKSNEADLQQKKWNDEKRQKDQKSRKRRPQKLAPDTKETKDPPKAAVVEDETKKKNGASSPKYILKRRRFHNFTPKAMAHDSMVFRRLDRCFHRATIRSDQTTNRPFIVLSLTGDMFLEGQVPRIIGLIVALVRGLVDPDFVDCVFDENYPHLIPTPPVPKFAMYMTEAGYELWEGKAQAVLTARKTNAFASGWNDPQTLQKVTEWKDKIRRDICRQWEDQMDAQGNLELVQEWMTTVLHPWAKKARQQLTEYRQWKKQTQPGTLQDQSTTLSVPSDLAPALRELDKSVPVLYRRVLDLLREINQSGRWPSTSTKRQLVMVATTAAVPVEGSGSGSNYRPQSYCTSSDLASNLATLATAQRSSSAYIFQQGEGGASGSFTVGAFPGGQAQPKSNQEFQALMKAAFALEVALRPDRPSSSTIAINRNAQFRPHTDSGAGAGQSTSLIVGLGDYVGGELVVEGETRDIRYQPVEFNGWKERHWTMPFVGERFSLVWFTPKGCEDIRGIDLCKTMA